MAKVIVVARMQAAMRTAAVALLGDVAGDVAVVPVLLVAADVTVRMVLRVGMSPVKGLQADLLMYLAKSILSCKPRTKRSLLQRVPMILSPSTRRLPRLLRGTASSEDHQRMVSHPRPKSWSLTFRTT
jgi:hypothetical protein